MNELTKELKEYASKCKANGEFTTTAKLEKAIARITELELRNEVLEETLAWDRRSDLELMRRK